jgi:hypothetical protein
MSIAGAHSNMGDDYQTLVALRYVVRMLREPDIVSVEIDATSLTRSGKPISVDDVG